MRSSKANAFTLIEVLLVIVIIAILTGLLLTGFSAVSAVDANTEAAKLMRSLQQLRSGWLAYYTDEHKMLGVEDENSDKTYDAEDNVMRELSERMEAQVADLIERYGNVRIVARPSKPDNGTEIYLGFVGVSLSVQRMLAEGGYVLYGEDLRPYTDGEHVLLRLK